MQCHLIDQRFNRKVCLKVVRKDILNDKILSAQYDGLAVDDGDQKRVTILQTMLNVAKNLDNNVNTYCVKYRRRLY
jgi:hypothetical protein